MITTTQVSQIQRSFRAQQILRRPSAVKQIPDGSGRWWVESQYHPGEGYIISTNVQTCTCPDYQRRRPAACKHIMAAEVAAELEAAGRRAALAAQRRHVKITDWDPQNGVIFNWHYADEPDNTPRCRICDCPLTRFYGRYAGGVNCYCPACWEPISAWVQAPIPLSSLSLAEYTEMLEQLGELGQD